MDLPGHGERSGKDHPDFKPSLQRLILKSTAQRLGNAVDASKLPGMDDAALTAASEAVAQGWQDSVIDGRRVIDYLETRTDIDPKRIFAFGQSMGGDIAFWLAASDPRIVGLATGISGAFDVTAPTAVAMRPYMSADSLWAFGEQISPKPVLVIASKDDPLVAVADYQRLIDVLKRPKVEWIAQKHNITRPGFDAVAEWFAQQLAGAPTTQPGKNP
jgi:dienelactone hydrolase